MKKIYICLLILFTLCLSGCGKKISKLEVENITACIDIFDISNYEFTVIYDDETKETKNISLSMLSIEDQEKLYDVGEHDVVLNYEGTSASLTIVLENRKAISIKATPENVTAYVNEFDYEMVTLHVEYNDNTSEDIFFDQSYISMDDVVLLGKPGTYDITISIDDVSTVVKFELLPNAVKIEDLTQDVIIYCITKKIDDKYQSVFYALGNKEFSGFQFKIDVSKKVSDYDIINKHENLYINDENLYLSFASSSNIKGEVELFTIEFISTEQYKNFTIDYDITNLFVYIKNNDVVEITDYLITLIR